MNLIAELERERSHADNMAGMAQFWMKRAQDAERLALLLVMAAGGEIVLHELDLIHDRELTLLKERRAEDMTIIFSTKTKQNQQGAPHE